MRQRAQACCASESSRKECDEREDPMPRDMFGDVNQHSIKIGNRKWYSVPVSLFSHAMIVLALVAIPILVPSAMPMPKITTIFSGTPPVPPEPPRPPQPRDNTPKPPVETGAPIVMPTSIAPEVPTTIVDPPGPDIG